MLVTVLGIVMCVMVSQLLNALAPIVVVWLDNVTLARLPHLVNVSSSTVVTPSGISTLTSAEQSLNAPFPMLVAPAEMETIAS